MSAFVESIARARDAVGARRVEAVPAPSLATRLESMHRAGIAAFDEQGLPSRRDERWKGTKVGVLEALRFDRVGAAVADASAVADDPRVARFAPDLLFVDGRLVPASSSRADLPEGVRILSLAEAAIEIPDIVESRLGLLADPKTDAMLALHAALFEDAAVVELERGARPGRALRVLSVATAKGGSSACFPRLLFVAGPSSEGMIVFESIDEAGAVGFTSVVSEFHLAADARIEAVALQCEGTSRVHLAQTFAELDRDARFASHVLSLSTGLVRSEVAVGLQAPGAMTRMNGFFLGRGKAHHDHFTTVDHAAPYCTSDEEYRGVLADDSAGVFRGRVIVRPGAQKTDARQSNPNLLLSEGASIDTKPQLEIYADDVKASHGSTIGQLDADALFFLRARGISKADAKLLLTRGFARSIVDAVGDETIRALVAERVEAALASLESMRADSSSRGEGGDA